MKPFDIYISSSQDVFENIALEEYFLTKYKKDILLFYINANAVVIGKHQNPWKEVDLSPDRDYKVIRRLSGGGTVYHDLGNINFSFIRNKERDFVDKEERLREEEEQKLASNLSDKYGKGSLDIETGTFTPIK